jgi:hypothetical protein
VCRVINWLRKFVQNAARLLKPIIDLTAKNKSEVVKWSPELPSVWGEIKVNYVTKPVLTLYDPHKELVIAMDASHSLLEDAFYNVKTMIVYSQ